MQETEHRPSEPARVLLFSHRNLYEPEVWRAGYREAEAIIEETDAVDLLAPGRGRWFPHRRDNAMRLGKYVPLVVNPGVQKVRLKRYYDLLFVVCEKPSELLNVDVVEGWKDYCKASICWLTEFYEKDMPTYKSALRVLAKCDHVFFATIGTDAFKPLLQGRMSYLPAGIDTIRFCPYPKPPQRFIDVFSIGRRSQETHRALLRMAHANELFYVYDTIKDLGAYNVGEHRFLLANMAKRSRYFIVNPGKIDLPEETGGQSEFGQRYFEGLAPGAILLGERPKNNREFDRIFNWPDAVIHVPYGSENIGAIIRELDKDPDRQTAIRRRNITQSLLSHDWAYRWESVLRLAGLQPMPKLLERKQRLANLAMMVANEPMETAVRAG
jgi:hypothetical protein